MRRDRVTRSASLGPPILICVICIAILACIGLVVSYAAGKRKMAATEKATEPAKPLAQKPVDRPVGKPTEQKPEKAKREDKPQQEEKPQRTFESVWAEAVHETEQAEAEEPKASPDSLKLLTAEEKMIVEAMLKASPGQFFTLADSRGVPWFLTLERCGFREHVSIVSAKLARNDVDFKDMMEAFWMGGRSQLDLAAAMRLWGRLDRFERNRIARAVKSNGNATSFSSSDRDSVIALGGREWLLR